MVTDRLALLELEPDVSAPARARHAMAVLAQGDEDLERRLALLTTELVTNSLRHGRLQDGDRIELRAERQEGTVLVEVHDPGHGASEPAIREPDLVAGGGLGLRLVAQVAQEWGAGRVPGDGMRAWFRVA